MGSYLLNGFSPAMLASGHSVVFFNQIPDVMLCGALTSDELVNAIGHKSTINLINRICQTNLKENRIQVMLQDGDEAFIVVVTERLEEGKVLSDEEITKMFEDGKIKIYYARVHSVV
ncbi:DNA binding protein [Captovirus AFV1]|uniref:Uncharacterized protein ORF116 n=1 Tax=Acidianus filamentous virus 1 (isolate United States/Yellowstone) TaxID=654909 RepID=Y116_AFV1Y|nr:DNA binding protein [Captovirus AFV1]Q70LB4.1 RecName: Full=Uncharacterized protein ORF116 [Acidianus filamentous virus 1 (isolate Yellowstone)]CAD98966.1 hypothetical protein [Captovirus AFV1]